MELAPRSWLLEARATEPDHLAALLLPLVIGLAWLLRNYYLKAALAP